jgi:SAM-dependent methyltransferase
MHWDRGYYSNSSYTCGAYRETAPNWLDFAALIKGHLPPREKEGSTFSYLELGSGMGFGLCLLATAYPEGSFVGVDFHPEHISHSLWLAAQLGLSNIHFLEADFVTLQKDTSPLRLGSSHHGSFHYVTAHGIATWVKEPVQTALLKLASAALIPGGVFYCSYNTYPGWLARTNFQKLYALERSRSDPSQPLETIRKTIASLQRLIGSEESPQPLGNAFPSLTAELAWISQDNLEYLCGEYANEGWAPLYAADMHQRCSQHKLRFLGSATLPELFEELLAPSLQGSILEEQNPLIRQTLIDLATNKAFRRDLFVKGALPLTRIQAEHRLNDLAITSLSGLLTDVDFVEQQNAKPYEFTTTFGQVIGDPKIYGSIESALQDGPMTLSELATLSGQDSVNLLLIVAMLLHAGRIGLDRGEVGTAVIADSQRVNRTLYQLIEQGKPYTYLSLPRIGSFASISPVELFIHKAILDGLEKPILSTCVLMGLEQLGVQLMGSDKSPLKDTTEQLHRIEKIAKVFLEQRLPQFQCLGALEGSPTAEANQARASSTI